MDLGKVWHKRKPDIPVIRPRASLRSQHIPELLKELAGIAKILNICAEKVKDHSEYVPILCEALEICRLPFLKEKTSDELNYAQDVVEFLSHIGCLMRVSDAEVRQHIVECVKSFYSCVAPKQLFEGLQPVSPGYRLQLLEHSDLAQTLLLSMATLENQSTIKLQLLQTLQFLSSSSVKNHNPLVRNFKLSYNNEDFKMKKLLLNLLVPMSKDFAAQQLYKEEQVMLALLTLVKPPTASSECRSSARHWSSIQQEELQVQALSILATIAPLMLDDYMSFQGNACLLLLLDWCVGQGEESVNQDLCDQGTINQLLGILTQMQDSPDEDDDAVTLEIKSDIQLVLSALCETDMHRKELFGSEGVEMAVHFLRKGSNMFYSGLGHNKLLLSTVDCVWSCIVGCYTTEDYFLAKQGAFLLLDLLTSSPRCVHGVILTTLLELCDNPNTLSHILSWRDEAGQTAPRLLLQLWREEEEDLGVSRDPQGVITDPQRPILSHYQLEDSQVPANMSCAAILEMSENLRAKIYSIFSKLGFQDLPGLSTKDYVTLSIIRRYLDFKVGEVWDEISRELILDGVRPIRTDEQALSIICKIAEETAMKVIAEQKSILEQQEKEDISEEELMYTKHFIGQIVSVESTDAQGPAGVKLTLARAPIKTVGQTEVESTTQDPEYFSTLSAKD
ncbi:Cilia- and flagella-associated protein 69 [Channa argus]|uniref:Cilia-and flagella-associated protein 69 n=1 Tax=Channa argus TaxID=215402 RepID=A0A6G1QXF6_CHAAH|nr:Cilia- and flagella-associated protein 69 [Channa argus]